MLKNIRDMGIYPNVKMERISFSIPNFGRVCMRNFAEISGHNFSVVGFREITVFCDYIQKYPRYGDTPNCENGENNFFYN